MMSEDHAHLVPHQARILESKLRHSVKAQRTVVFRSDGMNANSRTPEKARALLLKKHDNGLIAADKIGVIYNLRPEIQSTDFITPRLLVMFLFSFKCISIIFIAFVVWSV